jgi:hypothetical protein
MRRFVVGKDRRQDDAPIRGVSTAIAARWRLRFGDA